MNKKRNNELIKLADDTLRAYPRMFNGGNIPETYDGKTAALSVSVAMSDLLPTLAIYFQDYDSKHPDKPCKRHVLEVVARMATKPNTNEKFESAEALLRYSIKNPQNLKNFMKDLKKEIIECSIALKQVVRTYNLVQS